MGAEWFRSKVEERTADWIEHHVPDLHIGAEAIVVGLLILFGLFLLWPLIVERVRELPFLRTPPAMEIKLEPTPAWFGGQVDAEGRAVPDAMAYMVRITNLASKTLTDCQAYFVLGENVYSLTARFALRRGEHKLAVVACYPPERESKNPHLVVRMINDDGKMFKGQPALVLNPTVYAVRILSADAEPVTIKIRVKVDPPGAVMPPRTWSVELA